MDLSHCEVGRQVKASRVSVPDAWTVYDAAGNRVATKVNNIWRYVVYDAMGKLVAEYGEMSEGLGGVKYIQQDWQGSVRTVTNSNGFAVSRTDHQAFGGDVGYGTGQRSIEQGYNTDPATRQGYGLTERDDATGQDHTWFRKNENLAGRWTSPDPYNGSMNLGDPQSFNRYSYVQNEPTNFVDPSGLNMSSGGGRSCGPYDPMGITYYVDGFLTTACHGWSVLNSGAGYIDSHNIGGLTVVNTYEGVRDGNSYSNLRFLGQSYSFTGFSNGVGAESSGDCPPGPFGVADVRCIQREAKEKTARGRDCLKTAREKAAKAVSANRISHPYDAKLLAHILVQAGIWGTAALKFGKTPWSAVGSFAGGALAGGGSTLAFRVVDREAGWWSIVHAWQKDATDCGFPNGHPVPKGLDFPYNA